MRERYHITGMTCSACSSHVEKAANKLEGVEKASVNLLTETMDITYDENRLGEADIVKAVEQAGYGAMRMSGGDRGHTDGGNAVDGHAGGGASGSRDALARKAREEDHAMKRRLAVSVLCLIPLMYVAMYHMIYNLLGIPAPGFMTAFFHGNENAMIFAMTQFLLLLPILYMNRKFFSVGFKTLGHLSPNMDSLIAVGASAAIGYGLFAMYRIAYGLGHGDMALVEHYSHDLYFESAGTILTLITVGKYLESRSKGKTGEAITKLMDLSPKTALRIREDGSEEEVPTEALRAGDLFLVKPGSLIPVDGTVLEGTSGVDEAAITGESIPVEKRAGDKVISATLNKAGFLKCRADRVGEDTTLSQIVRLVEEASGSKAPIAQLADKVAGVFVPVVMGIALLTLLGWLLAGAEVEFAISTAIAVLVISCPCALGLATPVAIMVGTGVGAGNGILIKSGEALQRARDVDTVVLDKTGTITEGKLTVLDQFGYVKGMSLETVLTAAAALERKSEHPLAEAVLREAEQKGCPDVPVEEFRAVFGRGIQGVMAQDVQVGGQEGIRAGATVYVGNLAYLKEQGILERAEAGQTTSVSIEQALNDLADEGRTPLLVADESRILGVLGVADDVKPSSAEAIRAWRRMGVRVVMLTGDNRRTAEAVCRRMELSEVIAEVLPQDKEQKIRELQEAGRKVAMIGDGVNDAPALVTADVGMAIGAGTDVAIESADIILMKNDLRDAVTAMRLGQSVIRNIKQNLFWAFFYNCIGIPLAAGLLYPLFGLRLTPMFGAAAMSMSSIFVVTNALRLRGFKSGFDKKTTNKETSNKGGSNRGGLQAEESAADPVKSADAGAENVGGKKEDGPTAILLKAHKAEPAVPKDQEETKAEKGEEEAKKEKEAKEEKGKQEEQQKENEKKEEREGGDKMKKVITVEGMMCGHCTGRVQKALEAVDGVTGVAMSLEEKTATVELAADVADETLKDAVSEAGYEVTAIA